MTTATNKKRTTTTLDHLQHAVKDLDKARGQAGHDVAASIDAALTRIHEAADDVRHRAQDQAGEWQETLEHAGDVMQRPPTPLHESLLGADRGRRILLRGAVLTVLTLVPAFLLWRAEDVAWQTVLFTSIAFAELAGAFAMRSEHVSLRALGLSSNRALLGAVAVTVALQVLLLVVTPLRDVLGLQPLGAAHWVLVVGIALAYGGAVEADKAHRRRHER